MPTANVPTMTLPTIHSNGTPRQHLIDDAVNAATAVSGIEGARSIMTEASNAAGIGCHHDERDRIRVRLDAVTAAEHAMQRAGHAVMYARMGATTVLATARRAASDTDEVTARA